MAFSIEASWSCIDVMPAKTEVAMKGLNKSFIFVVFCGFYANDTVTRVVADFYSYF